MKSDQNILSVIISIAALILCYLFLWRLSTIESAISLITESNSPTFTSVQFQEVQTTMDRNVKVFTVLVTSLFTCLTFIIGFVGYGWINPKLDDVSNKVEESIDQANTNWNISSDSNKKKLNDIGLNFANTVITTAESLKETNHFNYVFNTLMGLANYKHFGYESGNTESTTQIILGQLRILNQEVTEVLTSNQPTRNLIWTYLSQLTSIRNQDIINEVNILRSKINDQ